MSNIVAITIGSVLLGACASQPSSDDRLQQLAADVERGGDYRTAAAMYQRVAEQTNAPAIYRQLGDAWLKAGEPDQAEAAYRQALSANGEDAQALLGLGSAQLEKNQPGYATQSLSKAAPQVDTIEGWSRLGVAQAMLGNGRGAEQAFQSALDKSPNSPDLQSNLALSQALAGDYPSAIAGLRRAVQSPLAQERHYRNLLLTLVLAGDIGQARGLSIPDMSPERKAALVEGAQRIRAIQNAPLRARAMGFRAPSSS